MYCLFISFLLHAGHLLHPHSTLATLSPPSTKHLHPFHLFQTTHFHASSPLSASFSFVGGEGRRTINCGEAATQRVECRETKEVENPMGIESENGNKGETHTERYQWDKHWHIRKSNGKHTIQYGNNKKHHNWVILGV